jgi:5-methylthioadenosine/S-adenosylhomocysteine deaminase
VPSRRGDPAELEAAALLGAAQLLRGGVTGVVDMIRPWPQLSFETIDAVAAAYQSAGLRAAIVPVVHDLPAERTLPLDDLPALTPAQTLPGEDQLAIVEALFRAWHGRDGRISIQVGPSGPQRCSDELLGAAGELARRLGTVLHTHALETRAQAEQARRRWGQSMIRQLDTFGLLTPNTVLAHVVWGEVEDASLLVERGCVVVHNPASNCVLGSGRAPLTRWLAAGVRVALGTDAATCNDGLSMFEAMKLATILHRPDEPDWNQWPHARDALTLASVGGAAAMALEDGAGRLVRGAPADLVVLDSRAGAFVPPNDLAQQLVMRGSEGIVKHVFVAGQIRVRDGALVGVDWEALSDAAARITAARGPLRGPEDPLVEPVTRMLQRLRGVA